MVDPYALQIDRPYRFSAALSARRGEGADTAPLVPKSVAIAPLPVTVSPPVFKPGRLVYELSVRAFTMRHPDIPVEQRGTIAALAHPAVLAHLRKIGVSAVELMPVTAWIDERHLPALGLTNSWGYNTVTFMALDPRLAPGGLAELRDTVAALRAEGIGVILDLVFNHTGESDELGPTLSLRGLDSLAYYRHAAGERPWLVNDTGTGNTVACDHPAVIEMVLDSLRHFVVNCGVDGFRFDLATILGRSANGFDAQAPLLAAMRDDPLLADRVMIAEPWDIGPDGYQLGNFGGNFLEWNDRYRDDVRRFWRGDRNVVGDLATCLAGSADIFGRHGGSAVTRSVNFIAAHDGMTVADLVAYERKHNEANGEQNRDGHNENLSWNRGVEGETDDPEVARQRDADVRALLATLFASRGTIMLTAGDEFGRTQRGNNNAYAQDNEITWRDWEGRDVALEDFVARLAAVRNASQALAATDLLTGMAAPGSSLPDVAWLTEAGLPLAEADWHDPQRKRLSMLLADGARGRIAVLINGHDDAVSFALPQRDGFDWQRADEPAQSGFAGDLTVAGRAVIFLIESVRAAG